MTKVPHAVVVVSGCLLGVLLGCLPDARAAPAWAADPAVPGPTLPPASRSLFDYVTADGVPYPFEALVRKIEARAGCTPGQCVKSVLIPLGRSLQRTAATPDFFAFPRAVIAFTGEGEGPVLVRDRIYLGYQEKANLVEVISFNETAGRFEFQLVRDYRDGGSPRVLYANRSVCTACHQNHAPIFSRQVWDETNANPQIAARLVATGKRFYGFPVRRGVDIPNAIDDAVHRANRIAVTQRIWREACDASCRRAVLIAALQYRLSGERAFEVLPLVEALGRGFAARWPEGLAIPNPELPNRNALTFAPGTSGPAQAHVRAPFEPLAPRPPLDVWTAADPLLPGHFVTGVADLMAESDVRELDAALTRRAAGVRRRTLTARCALSGDRYDCAGNVVLRGDSTRLDMLSLDGHTLRHLALEHGVPASGGLRARTASGDRVERVVVRRMGANGEAIVTIAEDFAPAREAIASAAWPDTPFSRNRLKAVLGLDRRAACCEHVGALGPPQEDIAPALPQSPRASELERHCGACHRTAERSPPNFLAGDASRVDANLTQCAPRIFVRLAMWRTPPATRDKVPMPPPHASRAGSPWMQTDPDPAIAALQSTVAGWLRAETGTVPDAAAMLARGYENLRPCLGAGS